MYNFISKSNRDDTALWLFHCFRVLNENKSTKSSNPYKSTAIEYTKRSLNESKRALLIREKSIILDIIKDYKAHLKYK